MCIQKYKKHVPSNVVTAKPLKCGTSDSVSEAALIAWNEGTYADTAKYSLNTTSKNS